MFKHSMGGHVSTDTLSVAHPKTSWIAPTHLEGKMLSAPKSEGHVDERWVKIPDLFTSIMSKEPVVNELYMASKVASDEWLRE